MDVSCAHAAFNSFLGQEIQYHNFFFFIKGVYKQRITKDSFLFPENNSYTDFYSQIPSPKNGFKLSLPAGHVLFCHIDYY